MKYFYSHLIDIHSLLIELDKLELTEHEKLHLAMIIDGTMHHHILEAILDELSEEDKQIFLEHLAHNDHQKIWEYLKKRVVKIEDKIRQTAEELKKQLHQDIVESKRLHDQIK